jgi:hypothetical protein
MLHRWLPGLLCLGLIGLSEVQAESSLHFSSGDRQVTLLELYTSQGCSSCPPAESWLNRFTDDDRLWKQVIPVAFHVDYWDYLGWRDPYALPQYSDRQRRYRSKGQVSAVYTPGFVVNGGEWKGWFSRDQLPGASDSTGKLDASISNNRVDVVYSASGQPLVLNMAILGFGIRQPVAAGENAGKTLPQEFVVLAHETHRSHTGQWQVNLPAVKAKQASRYALALWVENSEEFRPLQATGGWLPANRLERL